MCGLAGFFVGCGKLGSCTGLSACKDYRSPFVGWDTTAAFRTYSAETLEEVPEKSYFPSTLLPIFRHPIVSSLPPGKKTELLALNLRRYLLFTLRLETTVVNKVVADIINKGITSHMTCPFVMDVHKVYLDEAFHAFMCAQLLSDLDAREHCKRLPYTPFPFLAAFVDISEKVPTTLRTLVEHLFVVVSEVLITGTLGTVGRNETVAEPVRELVKAHAADESRHHKYFAHYFFELWAALSQSERVAVAPLLPEILNSYLRPDFANVEAELCSVGLDTDDAKEVVATSYTDELTNADRANSARALLAYFKHAELDQIPGFIEGLDQFHFTLSNLPSSDRTHL